MKCKAAGCLGEEKFEGYCSLHRVDAVLKERGSRYGEFKDHAKICQSLKTTMLNTPSWSELSDSQKQSLEVIADKIARMLNGDPNYKDNWVDIIGYSQLILNELEENPNQGRLGFDETTGD